MPEWKTKMLLIYTLLTEHRKKCYNYQSNNKYRQIAKTKKSGRRKCRSHLNHRFFSENLNYDPIIVFSKPEGSRIIRIM